MDVRNIMTTKDSQKRRNNHFVPVMLLNNFTDTNGNLYFFDRRLQEKRVLKTAPRRLYVERDLNTLRDESGNVDDSVERLFDKLEGKTAPVLKKIIDAVRTGEEPKLASSERSVLDHYSYCQWARVPDNAYYVLERSSRRNSFQEVARDLPDKEFAEFKKEILVEGFVSDIKTPSERILSFLGRKSLAFVIIRKKNKSFVIGSNPVLQVFSENKSSGGMPEPFVELWFPIAHDIAVAYGEGEEGLMEFKEYRGLRRFNEAVFAQSSAIAGPSKKLISSLAHAR